jgi:hypothetical protein
MDCDKCNPLLTGWCSYVEDTKGKMLDEKCPKVAAFIRQVLYKETVNNLWKE